MRAECLRSLSSLMQDEHISQRMSIIGECEAWIYKQSQEFFLKGKLVEKNVWPSADRDRQEPMAFVWSRAEFSPNIVHRKIKVVERDGR